MEESIQQVLTVLVSKFPMAMLGYMVLSGAYTIFCAVAAFTKTDKDDAIANRLKLFFSLPVKKL